MLLGNRYIGNVQDIMEEVSGYLKSYHWSGLEYEIKHIGSVSGLRGQLPAEALAQTSMLAREAERLGYHRFWVSEHHAAPGLAGSSPEVLMAHLAAVTSSIRIGSGAVLLPHYSAFKVAENFRVLEGLYPGRIDLGLGKAAGGAALAVRALQENRMDDISRYEGRLRIS